MDDILSKVLVGAIGAMLALFFKHIYDKSKENEKSILLAEAMKDVLKNVFILNLKEIQKDYQAIYKHSIENEQLYNGQSISNLPKISKFSLHSLNYIDIPFLEYFDKLECMKIIKSSLKVNYSTLVKVQMELELVKEFSPSEFIKIYNNIQSNSQIEYFARMINSRPKELSNAILVYEILLEEIEQYIEKMNNDMY
ncbi:hypothetical protein EG240_14180 [Paenimyroides tangerinum]|uniref:Uncharacterized protein n=1 Tax=Paenimyroides tangerinum TaxID=2488728 RepID=A0A3P3VZ38_9FLAO|nr:DUF2538 family protein [Paenimyroides tangerinum]RRJ88081.1 hypothetical protein EG240_14180 [Paenimyroides tangerinum]